VAVRPVVAYPNKILRQVAVKVEAVSDEVRNFCVDMVDTMHAAGAAGISAPQLAASYRMFAIHEKVSATAEPVLFINPEILEVGEMGPLVEGCLSFPGVYIKSSRPTFCRVKYQTWDGSEVILEANGLYAQAILHENDHLDGKLIIDKAGRVKREMITRRTRQSAGKYLDYRPKEQANAPNVA